jgi:hypothetical protein
MAVQTYTRDDDLTEDRYKTTETDGGGVSTTTATAVGGSAGQAFAGIAAVALAIVALANVFPRILTAIGVIVLGVAFLLQGATIAARAARMRRANGAEAGTGTEFAGGLAGIVLGILALVGVAPVVLIAVSAIVFGASLLFGSPAMYTVAKTPGRESDGRREGAVGISGAQGLIGVGAATLGILALCGVAPYTLDQVAILCVGAGTLLTGGAVTARLAAMLSR